jgi:leader peptidase (prepilin peptidase)/N-methyltransferase
VSLDLLAAALTALAGALSGLVGPDLVGRLREPEADPDAPPRPTFAELAALPGLRWRLATVGAPIGCLVGWQVGWTPGLAAWAYLTGICVILGYIDARTRLLPTQLIAPSYGVLAVLLAGAALLDENAAELWRALLGWAVMGGFYYLLWLLGPGLGYGDVRLSGLLALCLGFLGWGPLMTGLYSGFLLAGAAGALLLVMRRATVKTRLPFGPFMMLGALAGVLWGHTLSAWYVAR